MAERSSLWTSHGTGLLDVEDCRLGTGALLRPGSADFKSVTGIRPGAVGPGVVTASGTADGYVHVAPFQGFIQSSRDTAAGVYIVALDAGKAINILSTPADSTHPRIDLIIGQQTDEYYTDSTTAFTVKQVVGTPSSSPAVPSVSGSPDYITIAHVRVNAGVPTITSDKITDARPGYVVALGGIQPIPDQTTRDALVGIYDGFTIARTDATWIEVYYFGDWFVQGVAPVSSHAGLSAITSPYSGQQAYDTSIFVTYVYNGGFWGLAPGTFIGSYDQSSTQSIPNNTATALTWTSHTDPFGWHSTTVHPERVVPQIPGRYELRGGASFQVNGTGNRINLWGLNGVAVNSSEARTDAVTSFSSTTVARPMSILCNGSTDYLSLIVQQTSGAALLTDPAGTQGSHMEIYYAGPL